MNSEQNVDDINQAEIYSVLGINRERKQDIKNKMNTFQWKTEKSTKIKKK